MGKPIKYEEAQVAAAREMYLRYVPLKRIEEATGIILGTIRYYADSKWRKEREAAKSDLIDALSDSKRVLFTKIVAYGLDTLANSLQKLKEDDVALSPKEMSAISGIITDIDKIVRLDEGNPTEILANTKPTTIIELKKRLTAADPFAEIEDADYTELSNEESEDA